MPTKNFTLRLSLQTYAEVDARKKRSIAEYVMEAIEEKIARDKERDLSLGFESLAGSVDEEELSGLMRAQRTVMNRIDD